MDKILNNIEKTDTCWNWTGSINSKGYGELYAGGKRYLAHRVVYENLVGKIYFGRVIDHLCRNTRCVNPQHLEVVTNSENILRGNSPSGLNKRKTHCKWGHEFSKKNLVPRNRKGKFWRVCRVCKNERQGQYRKRKALLVN